MFHVSPMEAVRFGFRTFFRKFFFFLGVAVVAFLTMIAGIVASLIVSIPFLFPLFKVGGKLFAVLGSLGSDGVDKQAVVLKVKDFVATLFSSGMWVVVSLVLGFVIVALLIKMVYDYLLFGIIRISLELYDKGKSSIGTLFSPLGIFFDFFLGTFLYTFILLFGIILALSLGAFLAYLTGAPMVGASFPLVKVMAVVIIFILIFLPFIYWLIKFWFYPYIIIAKNSGPVDALKKSYNLKGGFKAVLLTGLIFLAINVVLGIIFNFTPIIGGLLDFLLSFSLYFTIALSGAFLYRKLTTPVVFGKAIGTKKEGE